MQVLTQTKKRSRKLLFWRKSVKRIFSCLAILTFTISSSLTSLSAQTQDTTEESRDCFMHQLAHANLYREQALIMIEDAENTSELKILEHNIMFLRLRVEQLVLLHLAKEDNCDIVKVSEAGRKFIEYARECQQKRRQHSQTEEDEAEPTSCERAVHSPLN